jgi:hypothetical protein
LATARGAGPRRSAAAADAIAHMAMIAQAAQVAEGLFMASGISMKNKKGDFLNNDSIALSLIDEYR